MANFSEFLRMQSYACSYLFLINGWKFCIFVKKNYVQTILFSLYVPKDLGSPRKHAWFVEIPEITSCPKCMAAILLDLAPDNGKWEPGFLKRKESCNSSRTGHTQCQESGITRTQGEFSHPACRKGQLLRGSWVDGRPSQEQLTHLRSKLHTHLAMG